MLLRHAFCARAVLDVGGQQQGLSAHQPATPARPLLVALGAIQGAGARPQQHGAIVFMPLKRVARLPAGREREAGLGNQALFGR